MHTFSSRIQSSLTDAKVELRDRARLTEVLVAEAIAFCLPLPSSAVDNPSGHYLNQHKVVALEKLSKVNEHLVIDIDQAEQLTLQLWLSRYRMVHCPTDHRSGRLMRLATEEGNSGIPRVHTEILRKYHNVALSNYHLSDEKDLT